MTQPRHMIVPLAVLMTAAAAALALNLTQKLGAHPWWADKVIWLGIPLGLGIYATLTLLRLPRFPEVAGLGLAILIAFGAATQGKARFAASFAEDAVAGQMWYFGWVATCAFSAAFLLSLLRYRRQNH